MQSSVGLFKTDSPILPTKGQMAERYRDKLHSNPKYRLDDATANFLAKAKAYGIDRLTAAMEEDDILPMYLNIEDGANELDDPFFLDCNRLLILSDIHLGLHERIAVEAAVNHGRRRKADAVLINGDMFDFPSLSKYVYSPDKLLINKEFQLAQEFLSWLRMAFPTARIIFKKGNHDERYDTFLQTKAPQLYNMASMTLGSHAKFESLGIEEAKDLQEIRAGKLSIFHGHELKKGGKYYTSAILGKLMCNTAVGHFHRTQESSGRTLHGEDIACWGSGCLAKLRQRYMPYPDANNGFQFVEFYPNGKFKLDNLRIIDGMIL